MYIVISSTLKEHRYFHEVDFNVFPTDKPHDIISPINRKL